MKRSNELAKNTLIIFIGTICTKMITFFLLPLYTGILSTKEYGIVDLLSTLVSLLLPIVTFQIEQAVFRELLDARNSNDKKSKIISSSIFSVILQCCVFVIIFLIFSSLIKNDYKFYLVANIIASIFASLFLQIARGVGDNTRYAIGSFVSAFSTIVFNILFLVAINLRVNGMLLGTLLGQVICAIYLFVYLKLYKYVSIRHFKWKIVKKLWKYSLPLIPNAISWWIFGSSDRVIVSIFLGLSMNGILSAASKFSGAYTILYNIFDRSWIESISLHINDDDIEDYFNKMFNEILKIFSAIIFLLISFMPFIYKIMINKNYIYGYKIVPILLLGALFNVVQGMIAVIYAAKKDTKSIAKTSFAAAIINIIIHFSLIKFIGLYAAAFSTLGAYMIIAIYRFIDIKKRYLNIKIDKSLILTCCLILAIQLPIYYINNFYLNLVSIIISIICSIFLNKNLLLFINNFIKNKKGVNKNEKNVY